MQIITARSGAGYSQPWHVYDPSIGIILGETAAEAEAKAKRLISSMATITRMEQQIETYQIRIQELEKKSAGA